VKYEKSCGAIIYRKKEGKIEYLLLKNSADHGSYWGFPKGHAEQDESEFETARREILEETGLKVRIIDGFREQIQYSPAQFIWKTVIYFVGEVEDIKQAPKLSKEATEFAWLPFKEALAQVTFKDNKEMLKMTESFLNTSGNANSNSNSNANGKKSGQTSDDDEFEPF
jgi:8-oxo-dGTP pyrophosphatase MutT (NUDIX family)